MHAINSLIRWILIILTILISLYCDKDNSTQPINEDETNWINGPSTEIDSTNYYVSTQGNDETDGQSREKAFRTLAKAFQSVRPGGTIYILPGTYEESLGLQNMGRSDVRIVVTGLDGIPTIDGRNSRALGIFCEQCKGMEFRNLKIKNYTDIGIGASYCENMTFENLNVTENGHKVQLRDWELEGYGIHIEFCERVIILKNDVSQNGPEPQVFPDYLMGTGINTFGNRDVLIRNNVSYQNTGGGILVEDSFDVLVDSNEVYENDLDASQDEWWDGGLWLDGGGNVTVRDNLFRNNLGPGIEISDEDNQHPTGYILENNISTENYWGIFIWNFETAGWPADSILHLSGNDFSGNSRDSVWIEARLE